MNYLTLRVAIVLAIALFSWGLAAWRKRRAGGWPGVEGTIEQVRLVEVRNGTQAPASALEIGYSYSVDGSSYGGYQQFPLAEGAPYSYLVGKKIEVRYKPRHPEASWVLSIPAESGIATPFPPNRTSFPSPARTIQLVALVVIVIVSLLARNTLRAPRNNNPGFENSLKAADAGNPAGQFNLALMYEEGRGIPKNDELAAAWYRRAAAQGHAAAQNNLGAMYQNGRGVPLDLVLAASWYQKAADQGYASAEFNLGGLYESGVGLRQDKTQAISWYRRAAAQGSPGAKNALERLGIRP